MITTRKDSIIFYKIFKYVKNNEIDSLFDLSNHFYDQFQMGFLNWYSIDSKEFKNILYWIKNNINNIDKYLKISKKLINLDIDIIYFDDPINYKNDDFSKKTEIFERNIYIDRNWILKVENHLNSEYNYRCLIINDFNANLVLLPKKEEVDEFNLKSIERKR